MQHLLRYTLPLVLLASSCQHSALPFSREHHPVAARAAKPAAPNLKKLKNGHYKVRELWRVQVGGETWEVEAGYRSNGITAPARIKNLLGDAADRPETWAAVFHDWLFTQPDMTRARADALFYQLLRAYNVPSQKAKMMHAAVTAFSASKQPR
jgi:Protein of unknown function (DUF1353)